MHGKVALEEHFALPETVQDSAGFVPGDYWIELNPACLTCRTAACARWTPTASK